MDSFMIHDSKCSVSYDSQKSVEDTEYNSYKVTNTGQRASSHVVVNHLTPKHDERHSLRQMDA